MEENFARGVPDELGHATDLKTRLSRKNEINWIMNLTSPAFNEGQSIPVQFTCDGRDVSPPLCWSAVPSATKSFTVICDDPDAPSGTFVHWVLYNLPGATSKLSEGISRGEILPNGAMQGLSDFKACGYGGPCPPAGEAHRYFFKLYALDDTLRLKPRATRAEVLKAFNGHVLGAATLMGRYQRHTPNLTEEFSHAHHRL